MSSNSTTTIFVTWGGFISPFRWSRIWPAALGASDEDTHQSVTILNEGSSWDASSPAVTVLFATLQANGQSGAPIASNIQVMASQNDSF
jgi:hypothetical protein